MNCRRPLLILPARALGTTLPGQKMVTSAPGHSMFLWSTSLTILGGKFRESGRTRPTTRGVDTLTAQARRAAWTGSNRRSQPLGEEPLFGAALPFEMD